MKNVLLIGPKTVLGGITERSDLPCKLLVIHDGFKALVGFLKLKKSNRQLDGVFLHEDASRAELPDYVQMLRAVEMGLALKPIPICLAVSGSLDSWQNSGVHGLKVVSKPEGESNDQLLDQLVEQLATFVAGAEE